VDSPDLAVNGRPGSVSITGCMGRMRALQGTRLEARVGETEAGEGCTVAAGSVATPARNHAHGKAGKRGEKGPVVLLTVTRSFWGTCVMVESGGVAGGRGAAARLGFAKQEAAAAGFTESRARGGGFIGRLRASACGPRTPRGGGHVAAGLRCESELGSSLRAGMTPREREGRGESRTGGLLDRGRKNGAGRAGRVGGREGKEKGRLGWAAWRKKKRGERRWAGPRGEKEREKKKCIQMHFYFEFKI
jgi:hypothetical protein